MKRLLILSMLLFPLLIVAEEAEPYYHSPAISPDGQNIAFIHNDDIYLVPAGGGVAQLLIGHESLEIQPRFSPNGKMLAFTSFRTGGGDVYTLNLETGEIKRLTFYESTDLVDSWSPDGKTIYFSSPRNRYRSVEIFSIPADGGNPVAVAYEEFEPFMNAAVSPDGSKIAFNTNDRVRQWWRTGPGVNDNTQIWIKGAEPGNADYQQFTSHPGKDSWPMWAPNGSGLYYVSNEHDLSANLLPENIYFKPTGGERRRITSFTDGRVTHPSIALQTGDIVFERDFGIWLLPSGGNAEPVSIIAFADSKVEPVDIRTFTSGVSEFSLSPDNKKVAFIIHGEVFVAPASNPPNEPAPVAFRVTETPDREAHLTWDKSSNRLFYVSHRTGNPDIYTYDFLSKEEKRLTETNEAEGALVISPNGKWLAYYRGIEEIRLINTEDFSDELFHKGFFLNEITFMSDNLAWSPDSKWLAFADRDENYFSNIFAKKIGDGSAPLRITNLPNIGTGSPIWSNDGRFIVFGTSHDRRQGEIKRVNLVALDQEFQEDDFEELFVQAKPAEGEKGTKKNVEQDGEKEAANADESKAKDDELIRIECEGIENRVHRLAAWTQDSTPLAISPDDKTLFFVNSNTGRPTLWSTSTDPADSSGSKQISGLRGSVSNLQFAKDKKNMWFDNGPMIVQAPLNGGSPRPYSLRAEMEIEFDREKVAAFREAWVLLRDSFYDASMNGQDWNAVYDHFLPHIKGARTHYELQTIMHLMLGDLNASHLGVRGSIPGVQSLGIGHLGLDFDPAELQHGRFKIVNIVPSGPVARESERVKIGDYLVSVNGTELGASTNLAVLLARKTDKRVILGVQSGDDTKDRLELKVKPVTRGEIYGLRYNQWVNDNRAYVEKTSNGRLGYVHISAMRYDNLVRFRSDLTAEANQKDGVVIDIRYNSGGYVATFMLDVLQRRVNMINSFRGRELNSSANMAGNRVFDLPTILVQNERNLSNGEMFAEGYRRMGLGKIVGTDSNGWVIWTSGRSLVNGMFLRLPRVKVATIDGEDLDETVRKPDVFVERPMGESHSGKDSQLDAAVKTLLEQIDGK